MSLLLCGDVRHIYLNIDTGAGCAVVALLCTSEGLSVNVRLLLFFAFFGLDSRGDRVVSVVGGYA